MRCFQNGNTSFEVYYLGLKALLFQFLTSNVVCLAVLENYNLVILEELLRSILCCSDSNSLDSCRQLLWNEEELEVVNSCPVSLILSCALETDCELTVGYLNLDADDSSLCWSSYGLVVSEYLCALSCSDSRSLTMYLPFVRPSIV